MKLLKNNDGLTLVELMVSIAIGSMILLATVTVLLLGFRIQHNTTKSVTQQYTARTVVTLLENLASEGSVDKIERQLDGSWKIYTESKGVRLSYSSEYQTIYLGDLETPMLENVVASYLTLKNKLLTISFEDNDNTYSTSIYCRFTPDTGLNDEDFVGSPNDFKGSSSDLDEQIKTAKNNLLNLLLTQVGNHGGVLSSQCGPCPTCKSYVFFSEWYIGSYAVNPSWNANTPWCACFVSWGLAHTNLVAPEVNWFANVDLFMDYFINRQKELDDEGQGKNCWKANPAVGDLIFFDMTKSGKNDPSHVGVVLNVKDNIVTTIEGNSADMVAIREYKLDDPRILGYGDPWAAQKPANSQTD